VRALRLAYKVPLAVLATAVCAAIAGLAGLLAGRRRPWVLRLGAGACRAWGRLLCATLAIERDVSGPVPTDGVFLVAANHLSYIDILVLASLYPSTFVAKREIASWPVFGLIARGAGTLFVDRNTPKDVMRAGREMSERLGSGIALTIFPEGRSSPGELVHPFQPALLEPAAKAGIPCIAVSITYETPGSPEPPSRTVCWYDSESFVRHFRRLAGLKRVVARVRFTGPPLVSDDRKTLARELWERTVATFVPIRQT
jgi:1-acyl-sn-glycerol-3-phosphate acyltransferase